MHVVVDAGATCGKAPSLAARMSSGLGERARIGMNDEAEF